MKARLRASSCARYKSLITPALITLAILLLGGAQASAGCPPGESHPITSGDGSVVPPVVIGGLGLNPRGVFYIVGHREVDSGQLPVDDWLIDAGDLDGDGLREYRIEAPGEGEGGWGDPLTNGCPSSLTPSRPPIAILIDHDVEDLDGDGVFDVFEDFNGNGILDRGEDLDGDFRLTGSRGCEGQHREDFDCDGHLDFINEDLNGNGVLDPGEDLDGDGRLDRGIEDRNGNRILDDRPFVSLDDLFYDEEGNLDPLYPYGAARPAPGGILIASVAWNGAAYDLSAINTPTRSFVTTGGQAFRVIHTIGRERLAPRASSPRLKLDDSWRMRIQVEGLELNDDVGGQRVLFDGNELETGFFILCPAIVGSPCPPPPPRFVETGTNQLFTPSGGGGGSETVISIQGADRNDDVPGIAVLARLLHHEPATGSSDLTNESSSQTNLTAIDPSPAFHQPVPSLREAEFNILDGDHDGIRLPLDNCPDEPNSMQEDDNHDGLGNACDPGAGVSSAWIRVATDRRPGVSAEAAAAFDPKRGVLVWFGGVVLGETWEFNGTSWTLRSPGAAPEARSGHRIIYDLKRKRVLLFGGRARLDGELLSDLWQFRGNNWSRIEVPLEPHPRTAAGLAYDAERDRMILFGGLSDSGLLDDTWLFDGESWERVPGPRTPAARHGHQMTWDSFRRVTVLHGGHNPALGNLHLNDTWEYDGSAWQPVDYRGALKTTWAGSLVFDTMRRRTVLIGGRTIAPRLGDPDNNPLEPESAATRVYDGRLWESVPTRSTIPPGINHAVAFDTARGVLVAHGGTRFGTPADATWELHYSGDEDGDGLEDALDNCPLQQNPDQADRDGDGSGDLCDNCPETRNPWQRDLDRDGAGDACDDDDDGDGVPDGLDICPSAYVDGRPVDEILDGGGPDGDGDGTPDDCDLCPGDARDDADGDGVCGDADNCPLAGNALQHDRNGDGAGDACQAFVDIISVAPHGDAALEAKVVLKDPDGDALSGEVRVLPLATLHDVLRRPGEECDLILEPDGVPNEGIIYGEPFGSPSGLADADSIFPCGDGLPDFELALGTCEEVAVGPFSVFVSLREQVPISICVRRVGGSSESIDFTVWRFGDGRADLAVPSDPIFIGSYAGSRLPRRVDLDLPSGPTSLLLVIEAGDGTTPPVGDSIGFTRTDETRLFLKAINEAPAS